MVRQFLEGQRFFKQEFGFYCKEVENNQDAPDVVQCSLAKCLFINMRTFASLLPVLASRYIRLLGSTPSDYAGLRNLQLPHTEAQLEPGQHFPSERVNVEDQKEMNDIPIQNLTLSPLCL